jgi:ADP-heptose:LPS heptosyltransferase
LFRNSNFTFRILINMNKYNFKKILLLRFSSLGDIILTTPLLKVLKNNFPEAEIDYCIKKSYADIVRYNPAINKVLEVSDDMDFAELSLLKRTLKKRKYDLVLDLHKNLRTFYLRLFLRFGSRVLVFKKYSFRKFLLVKFKINFMKSASGGLPPIAQRYIDCLKTILSFPSLQRRGTRESSSSHPSFPNSSLGTEITLHPEIYTNENAKESVDNLIGKLNVHQDSKLICIVPSSKHFTKTYPAENYIELINKFDKNKYSFLLVGKGNDKKNIDMIKSKTGDNVYDLCDKLNLLELTELMKKCNLIISGDTGPMHIAEAVNVPILILAGSSVKEFGFYPIESSPPTPLLLQRRGGKNTVLEVDSLPCRPCSHIGRDSCPKGHFRCMKDVSPETVYKKAVNLTSSSKT